MFKESIYKNLSPCKVLQLDIKSERSKQTYMKKYGLN